MPCSIVNKYRAVGTVNKILFIILVLAVPFSIFCVMRKMPFPDGMFTINATYGEKHDKIIIENVIYKDYSHYDIEPLIVSDGPQIELSISKILLDNNINHKWIKAPEGKNLLLNDDRGILIENGSQRWIYKPRDTSGIHNITICFQRSIGLPHLFYVTLPVTFQSR